MTQQEIIEGEKLLLEFMGYKLAPCRNGMAWEAPEGDPFEIHGLLYSNLIGHGKFHYSWDWLMKVVEKIEEVGMAHVCIFNKSCWIEFYGVHNDPCKFSRADKDFITNVWNTCVAFIEWYNQNKEK